MNTLRTIAFVFLLTGPCMAGEFHVRRARSLHCIPDYGYQVERERLTTVGVSKVAVPLTFKAPVRQTNAQTIEQTVDGKRFVIGSLVAGPVQLSQISATADETGQFRLSAVLTHSGGDSGELVGGRIGVQVRAIQDARPEGDNRVLAGDFAQTLWTTSARYWVSRRERKSIAITAATKDVARGFSRVRRVEVQLVYLRDR